MQKIFQPLWEDYVRRNPHVKEVHDLFVARGENVINDHIALRTFNDPRIGVDRLANYFIKHGYKEKNTYDFPVKKLFAKHYEHSDPKAPKVFISELILGKFSPELQKIIHQCIDKIPETVLKSEQLINAGVPWAPLDFDIYKKLLDESEYAAWMYAFGFCVNHFTVNVNELKTFSGLEEVNEFLKSNGFKLNNSGGEIKGTPKDYLEQSSTLAGDIEVKFTNKTQRIPSCYYEFAKRHRMPNGELYTGFVAASADKIFESTDIKHFKKQTDS